MKRIELNWEQFEGQCAIQTTLREIADYYNCSEDTIERRVKEHYHCGFADIFKRKRQVGLMSLRRNMFKMSEKSPQMAIFLAKNWLGMKDVQDIEGTLNQNIKQEIDVKVVNFNSKEVSDAVIEAIKLGLDTTLLGGNGHSEDASVLPTQADVQTTPVPESKN